jgi:hypothetical protein
MKKLFVSFCISIVCWGIIGSSAVFACENGYPHVAKKNGTYDARQNDLWELAQDYVFYRNEILVHHRKGDQKGAAKARSAFQKTNNWLSQYPEEHVNKALELAEECRK